MKKQFTKEGIEKLKKSLEEMEKKERKRVAEKLKHAASFGDLSENSEYEDAKNEQNMLEMKISKLRETIKEATIIKKDEQNKSTQVGAKISVENKKGEVEEFEIVSSMEADPLKGKVSCDSPMGKAFLNKKEGDLCVVKTPAGEEEYKIIKIAE